MTGIALTIAALASAFLFPWPFTALIALAAAFWEPLVPLAAGILLDALYWTPAVHAWPYGTLAGAIASLGAFFLRSRLRPDLGSGRF